MNRDRYLSRLGVDLKAVTSVDHKTLERLHAAHVTTIPFETLSITGGPYGRCDGTGVSLAISDIYDKIITQYRGGFCYELNGLFCWLLADIGFDLCGVPARIKSDGEFGPPADHLTIIVELDERYLVDVGFGIPKLREPLPLDGTSLFDTAGIGWRITNSDRPDADFALEFRSPGRDEWSTRCIIRDVPRTLEYFQATCEHFERAPDSPFTGDPIVTIATGRGHAKLSPTTVSRSVRGDVTERSIDSSEWFTLLAEDFGVAFPPGATNHDPEEPRVTPHQ